MKKFGRYSTVITRRSMLTVAAGLAALAVPTSVQADIMKLQLTVNDKAVTAALIDSETTRDFVSLLPLTITMTDLFCREKSGDLPRAIADGGARTRTYEVGDVVYWSPSAHLAIYYRHDGQPIPGPGIIVMGKIDSGVEALNVPGSIKVRIKVMK